MNGFWASLKHPFFVLAPMEDVTDTVFRQIVASVGRPDVFFTEFANVEGILSSGQSEVIKRLKYTPAERPLVAQIWGTKPEKFKAAAELIVQLGFDGIDLNFGCPERAIVKQGGCSALIGNYPVVKEIIAATKEGAGSLPVSLKTRIGRNKIITEEWVGWLLEQNLAALTIHGRTAAEMSAVPTHWDEIGKVVALRDQMKSETLILGNGDIKTLDQARCMVAEYGVDGVMIGRGIFDNVALFAEKELDLDQKIALFKRHIELYEQTWGKGKNFQVLKKFVKTYIGGFAGATALREQLFEAKTAGDLLRRLNLYNNP